MANSTFLKKQLLLFGVVLISVAAFLVDLRFTLGVSGDAAYVLIVMATYWTGRRVITFAAGIVASLLIILTGILSPAEHLLLSGAYHFFALIVVWASVWFVNYYRTSLNKIQRNQQSLQHSQQLAQLGSFELDLEKGEAQYSEELYRIFELDPQEDPLSYESFREMVHPDDIDQIDAAYNALSEQKDRQEREFRIKTGSGETKYLYSIWEPIVERKGEVTEIFGTIADVTHQKKIEEKLKESERRYRSLFQLANDQILVFQIGEDYQAKSFLEVNDTACNMLGYSRKELLQKSIYDIATTETEKIEQRIKEVLRKGEAVFEARHITKEGDIIPLELSLSSFSYDGLSTFIAIGRDLRGRQKLEKEILNISEMERQRIGQDLHDDLGQLLSVAKLKAESLQKQIKSGKRAEVNDVEEIVDLINTVSEHARTLSHGLVPPNIESEGLNYALQELMRQLSTLHDVNLCYKGSSEDLSFIDSDSAVHLFRIAQEAINNAIKHANAQDVEVDLFSSEGHLTLRIKDNGSGFIKSETMSNEIGLRSMKYRARIIGGDLEINTQKGIGTSVVCRIPVNQLTN